MLPAFRNPAQHALADMDMRINQAGQQDIPVAVGLRLQREFFDHFPAFSHIHDGAALHHNGPMGDNLPRRIHGDYGHVFKNHFNPSFACL